MRFRDRQDAGRQLAGLLAAYKSEAPLVLGLPRGGVVVAAEVAEALGAALDVWVVRKVGAPDFPELGLGAVAEGGRLYLNREMMEEVGATEAEVEAIVRAQSSEIERRLSVYRSGAPAPALEGRTVLLVDDGIATGGTVRAAVLALREGHPKRIVLAVPIAATQALEALSPLVDDVVCVDSSPSLYAIGAWYDDFRQVRDEEVVRLLEQARVRPARRVGRGRVAPRSAGAIAAQELSLPLPDARLSGTLSGPRAPRGLVLFAHGSGSSRFSPRNRHVASVLHGYGLATLLFDLLTRDEEALDEETAELRFDIGLLARRLIQATDWSQGAERLRTLPLGYFGSSTGAAAALVAASERPALIQAVVSRGGRPDLAWDSLPEVRAPTLLIVGGADRQVIALNQEAASQLATPHELVIVPGASHLFEEPGALDAVARLAGEWFSSHLGEPASRSAQPGGSR